MKLVVHLDSPVPLADQVVAGIKHAIASGGLKPGDALPPVRQLANDLDVNFNTIARGYRELERCGLISTVRGRGTVVTATEETPALPGSETEKRVVSEIRQLLTHAKLKGVDRGRFLRLFEAELGNFYGEGGKTA